MRNVAELTQGALRVGVATTVNAVTEAQPKVIELQGKLAEWFNGVFDEILALCPRWGLSLTDDGKVAAAKRVWLQVLADNGVTKKTMVDNGLRKLAETGSGYLPTPAEFVRMCKVVANVPSQQQVSAEIKLRLISELARRKPFSHPIVEWISQHYAGLFHHDTQFHYLGEQLPLVYANAVELWQAGELELRKPNPYLLAKQRPDPNLEHYFFLKKVFGEAIAADFLSDCRTRGIVIDPIQQTVKNGGLL